MIGYNIVLKGSQRERNDIAPGFVFPELYTVVGTHYVWKDPQLVELPEYPPNNCPTWVTTVGCQCEVEEVA